MEEARVALVRCTSYDEQEVFDAVRQGVGLLGGTDRFAAHGERLLLKPNVLAGDPSERAVCTHPAVVKAVTRLFRDAGAGLSIGDSPEYDNPAAALEACGIGPAAREVGLQAADFDQGRSITLQGSPYTRSFTIAHGALEADGIINLPKLKTHLLTRMTGAVKNLYGCIPGRLKKTLHVLNPTPQGFSRMLVALNLLLKDKTRLHIMDGIVAMEGNGPRGGDPKPMGVLLFSNDPVALDALMCRLVELNPLYMPSARPGRAWGLGTYMSEEIEVLGDQPSRSADGDFRVQRGQVLDMSGTGLMTYVSNVIGRRPVIDRRKCTRCGQCVEICPVDPKAVDWHDGNKQQPPTYKYLRCIRCYCCQETCPDGAISVKSTILKL
jgi:uncharacterized protein (DUF362 family)/NAD-dependent dihydropyrimidine dehydrogenase PreA subunit